MIQIDDKVISLEVFSKKFICDVPRCIGICCVLGDSGAPLEDEEVEILKQEMPNIEPYMREKGIQAVKDQGIPVIDQEGDKVTALINGAECAYVIIQDGINICAIEKAWNEGKTHFRKPISCHLYPIRAKQYHDFEALNYDKWDICQPARELGYKEGVPVYKFLKDPIIRKYGEAFYNEMEDVDRELKEKGIL